MAATSVYESAGGAEGFLALSRALHRRCLEDPVLNHPFSHALDPAHDEHLAAYLGELVGGPPLYSKGLGGQVGMLARHAGTGADDDFPERFVACLDAAMGDVGCDERVARVLHDAVEAVAHEIQALSPVGSRVPVDAAMPRWSWDGPIAGEPR